MGGKIVAFYINGNDPKNYGACALLEYVVSGTTVTNTIFQGRNRSSYRLLAAVYGQKKITFSLVYHGKTFREASLLRSKVESWMWGKVELFLPDGFYYTSTLQSIGDGTPTGKDQNLVLIPVKYEFSGIQHDALVTVDGESFINPGTLPYSDCTCSATVGTAADSYLLAGCTFQNVVQGEKLVVDGINGRLLRNGAPAPGNVTFTNFPKVVPGENSFTAPDPVTVQFYPSYL